MRVWFIKRRQKIIIFGTGSGGAGFYKKNTYRYNVIGFLDNNASKHGGLLYGLPIYSPEQLDQIKFDKVVIASDYYKEIYEQLVFRVGVDSDKIDFFFDSEYQRSHWWKSLYKEFEVWLLELACKNDSFLSYFTFWLYTFFSRNTLQRLRLGWLDELDDMKIYTFRPTEPSLVYGPQFINKKSRVENIKLPEVALYRFTDAEVKSVSRAICISGGKVVLERVLTAETKNADYRSSKVSYHGRTYALVRYEINNNIEKGILINGFSETNYYHLMVEVLSQLQFVREIPSEFSSYPLLLPANCLRIPAIRDFLEYVLPPSKEIVFLNSTQNYQVNDLLYINMPNALVPNLKKNASSNVKNGFVRRESLLYLRNLAYKMSLCESEKGYPTRIFLGRKPGLRSYNQDEIIEALTAFGFTCVYLEDLSFCEQVRLMANAEFIVGPTGAAWTNLIFSNTKAKALCWMAEEWGDLSCFSNLAATFGIDMQYLTYTAGTSDSRELYSRQYSIPVASVVSWIALRVDAN